MLETFHPAVGVTTPLPEQLPVLAERLTEVRGRVQGTGRGYVSGISAVNKSLCGGEHVVLLTNIHLLLFAQAVNHY